MRALVQRGYGAPERVLECVELPQRAPGPAQLQVEVVAAPIQPVDRLRARGLYPVRPPLPGILGSEGVGRVLRVGADLRAAWAPGDLALLPLHVGSYRSHMNVAAGRLIKLPADIDPVQACMLKVSATSADLMLERCGLAPGQAIVNLPASGSVGQCLTSLAKIKGLDCVNLVRSPRWRPWLSTLHPGARVELVDPQLSTRLSAHPRARVAFDGIGGPLTRTLAAGLVPGGTVVNYGAVSRKAPELGLEQLLFRGLRLEGFWLHRWIEQQPWSALANRVCKLATLMNAGQLQIKVAQTFGLDAFQEAFAAARDPQTFGRVVLRPSRHT